MASKATTFHVLYQLIWQHLINLSSRLRNLMSLYFAEKSSDSTHAGRKDCLARVDKTYYNCVCRSYCAVRRHCRPYCLANRHWPILPDDDWSADMVTCRAHVMWRHDTLGTCDGRRGDVLRIYECLGKCGGWVTGGMGQRWLSCTICTTTTMLPYRWRASKLDWLFPLFDKPSPSGDNKLNC